MTDNSKRSSIHFDRSSECINNFLPRSILAVKLSSWKHFHCSSRSGK